MLGLLCVLVLCAFQQVHSDNAAASCGNFMKDWYPSIQPQSSAAPYMLNVSDENGNFSQRSWRFPTYGFIKTGQTVRLGGLMSGNDTEKFIGFLIIAKNEFEDEENGRFIAPFPDGASRMECKDHNSQMIEVVQNSTSGKEWTSIDIKWRAPEKYPAGKITIRLYALVHDRPWHRNNTSLQKMEYFFITSASVVKEHGVYWEGISVTLGYHCAGPRCANYCPNGYAKTKFGCTTCTCAGAQAISGSFFGLLVSALSLFRYFMM